MPRSKNIFDDKKGVVNLSIQYLSNKNMPPKAATFWNRTKKFDSKNIEINEMVTCFFTGVTTKIYLLCTQLSDAATLPHFSLKVEY